VIAEGGAAVGKSSYMPSWKSTLKPEDIENVIAYIRTLPKY
jgi:mono/diheme cytochrome c family protein